MCLVGPISLYRTVLLCDAHAFGRTQKKELWTGYSQVDERRVDKPESRNALDSQP